jgi:hypothetical protein
MDAARHVSDAKLALIRLGLLDWLGDGRQWRLVQLDSSIHPN